jgi:type I thyroxine 5'-deiodinase
VYIREAHADDEWQLEVNRTDNVVFASPKTFEERCQLAEKCFSKLGIEFPAVVDDMNDSTEKAYTAWPDRLYVVDRDGRIAYKSAPGPFGFKPDGVAGTLAKLLP